MGKTLFLCLSWLFVVVPASSRSFLDEPLTNMAVNSDQTKPLWSKADLSKVHRSLITKQTTASNSSTSTQAVLKQIFKAYNFLKQYNYLSHTTQGNRDIKTALETFQRFMHLPVTGLLDNTTLKEMGRKRCGVPDVEISHSSLGRRRKRFAVSKKKWTKTTLLYAYETFTTDMTVQDQKRVISKAFKMWSDFSPLVFTATTDLSKAHIKIMFGTLKHGTCRKPFDGQGSVLAHAFYPSDGRLHFDDDEYFTDGTYSGTNLLSVAVHEIGHTLGLAHSTDQNSLMFPVAQRYVPNLTLSTDDKNAIKYLYAGGTSSPGSSVCQDIWLSCASITSSCLHYPGFMNTICRKTCKFCV